MEESRKRFIEFAKKEGLSLQTGYSGYVNLNTQLTLRAWDTAWQASRAAIEIELPEVAAYWNGTQGNEVLNHRQFIADTAEAIRAAGLKIKGE